jgi:hypothetical protein
MLRFTIALLAAVVASGTAESADRALAPRIPHRGWHRAVVRLPPGLPRPHYRFRTTISYDRPAPQLTVYEVPARLYAPVYADVPYFRPVTGALMLPGASTLPAYYGSAYTYEDLGAYYDGAYVPYWDRLPYACGVYGYC